MALVLACAGVLRAGDAQPQASSVSLLGDADAGTNASQFQTEDSESSRFFMPHAPKTLHIGRPSASGNAPPPPQGTIPTERDRELLDRRKNWVFMTPEELMGTDSQKDSVTAKDADPEKPSGVMERYYQGLLDSDRLNATNKMSDIDVDSWTKETNSFGSDAHSALGTFDSDSGHGIFQPTRAAAFSGIFGSGSKSAGNAAMQSHAEVRVKAEQTAHMESFKALLQSWDADQHPAPVAPTPTPVQSSGGSGPLFGSTERSHSLVNPFSPTPTLGPPPAAAPPPTISSVRANSSPPHSTFAPPQRPF